ncbi:hypothetical protein J8J04_02090 ['Fragaria x ananassa' phyllody phytoplasma]|uniref:Uncharacterized protein n=1 Tax='Fragaria x ananassa' phyllody phytoplasma TaxID=2358428 RepID=A0ABS5K3I1_9MOLU|nr:hypothetical protein ['Fragaria x ananassa' phyllody phytoplasma]MBS2126472.1 hypothetical protein ['Fragaria x ananassa' phyllody phytoplasma]
MRDKEKQKIKQRKKDNSIIGYKINGVNINYYKSLGATVKDLKDAGFTI